MTNAEKASKVVEMQRACVWNGPSRPYLSVQYLSHLIATHNAATLLPQRLSVCPDVM